MKSILFIGNTNCMPFRYALHLKKMGHAVRFYIDAAADQKLHRPEYLFPEISMPYPDWIIDLGWSPRGRDYIAPPARLARLIAEINSSNWDAIVLCGQWLKLANHLTTYDALIALLAGSDLDVIASYSVALRSTFSANPVANLSVKLMHLIGAYLQRRGIRRASLVNYYPEGINPIGDRLLQRIMRRRSDYRRLQNRGLSVENTPYVEPSQRRNETVVVFSPTRFIWRSPLPAGFTEQENKRNDIMLRGIAHFFRKTNIPIRVHLVEKGIHVAEAKQLAIQLGIDGIITWHQEMSLGEILGWYARADIVLDQFGSHWLGAGAVDSMLMGRPVIGKARNEVFAKVLGEPMPMCDASDEQEISRWLELLVDDPTLRKRIGIESREYMLRHFDAKETAMSILTHIDHVKSSRNSLRTPGLNHGH